MITVESATESEDGHTDAVERESTAVAGKTGGGCLGGMIGWRSRCDRGSREVLTLKCGSLSSLKGGWFVRGWSGYVLYRA